MHYTIFLVRHGEYDNPQNVHPFHLPVTLSAQGRHHMLEVGIWMAHNTKQRTPIVASPIVRTIQSAEIMASHTHSQVTVDERLIEVNCPALQGKQRPATEELAGEEYYHAERESAESITDRMWSVYAECVERRQDVILVSHGDPLALLYYKIAGKQVPARIWLEEDYVQKGEVVAVHYTPGQDRIIKRVRL